MNRVSLIGNICNEITLRYTSSNIPVAHFTIAVNRPIQKDKDPQTDFIDIVVWNKQAENVKKYLTKGKKVGVTGRIQTSIYEKDEKKYKQVEINADNVEFLSSSTNSQETKKQEDIVIENKSSDALSDDVFAQFGDSIEITDDMIAF